MCLNDLPDSLDVESSLFADDSCVFKSGKNLNYIRKCIQKNLEKIPECCDLWGLVVFSHRKDLDIQLSIYNQQVKVEGRAKFLGLVFDSKLNWNEHIKYIEDKCKKRLNLMRAVAGNSWGASKKALLTIYRSLIRSVIHCVSKKNPCDYVFDDNLNSKCPIVIILGTVIT